MASNLDFAEDIEEAKAYMAKKNVFQLFEVRKQFSSICFEAICHTFIKCLLLNFGCSYWAPTAPYQMQYWTSFAF